MNFQLESYQNMEGILYRFKNSFAGMGVQILLSQLESN